MIHHSPHAPVGSVLTLSHYNASNFTPSDAVLCRNVAPLIAFAFNLIGHNVGCRVLGREIGTSLAAIVKKANASSLDELEVKLIAMREREVRKHLLRDEVAAAAAAEDKYDCLNLFIQHASSIDEIIDRITTLFDDSKKGLLTLATVHKSKGLEWPTVFILDPQLMPSKWAKLPWQQIQETNIKYVAVTRAQVDLRYITSGGWKDEPISIKGGDEPCQDTSLTPIKDEILGCPGEPESNPLDSPMNLGEVAKDMHAESAEHDQ